MGSFVGNTTKTGLSNPATGGVDYGSAADTLAKANKRLNSTYQPPQISLKSQTGDGSATPPQGGSLKDNPFFGDNLRARLGIGTAPKQELDEMTQTAAPQTPDLSADVNSAAKQSGATAVPAPKSKFETLRDTILNNWGIGGTPGQAPTVDTSSAPQLQIDTPAPEGGKITQPSFAEAMASAPDGPSKMLTIKGQILRGLLNTAKGAAAGAGDWTVAEGYKDAQNAQAKDFDIRNAPIFAATRQRQAQENIAKTKAETQEALQRGKYYEKGGRAMGTINTKGGTFQLDDNGNWQKIPGSEGSGKELPDDKTVEGRRNIADSNPDLWKKDSPEYKQYIAYGDKIPKGEADTPWSGAVAAAGGDKAEAFSLYARKMRPNYAGQNQEDQFNRSTQLEGRSARIVGQAMSETNNDPDAAIAKLNKFLADPGTSPNDAAAAAHAMKVIEAQKNSSVKSRKLSAMDIIQKHGIEPSGGAQ